MTVTESYWQLLTLTDIYWKLLTVTDSYCHINDSYWKLLTVNDNYWELMTVTDRYWQLLIVIDSYWELLPVLTSHKVLTDTKCRQGRKQIPSQNKLGRKVTLKIIFCFSCFFKFVPVLPGVLALELSPSCWLTLVVSPAGQTPRSGSAPSHWEGPCSKGYRDNLIIWR